jgi:hypothetical protein
MSFFKQFARLTCLTFRNWRLVGMPFHPPSSPQMVIPLRPCQVFTLQMLPVAEEAVLRHLGWRAHSPQVRGCGVLSRLRRPRLWTTHSEKISVYSAKFVWMKCILDHIRLCKLLCKMCKWLCKWLWASLRMNFFLFTHVHGSIWFWLFNFHPANFDKFCLTARVGAQCYTPRSRNDHWSGLVDPIEHVFPIFSDRQSWMP